MNKYTIILMILCSSFSFGGYAQSKLKVVKGKKENCYVYAKYYVDDGKKSKNVFVSKFPHNFKSSKHKGVSYVLENRACLIGVFCTHTGASSSLLFVFSICQLGTTTIIMYR